VLQKIPKSKQRNKTTCTESRANTDLFFYIINWWRFFPPAPKVVQSVPHIVPPAWCHFSSSKRQR